MTGAAARQADEHAWVDGFALVLERSGLPPMAARILARLMICVPAEQSSQEIAEWCDASKGAVSTATRWLVQLGLAERVRVRGDRASYFRVRDDAWTTALHAEAQRLTTFLEFGRRGLALLHGASPDMRARLQEFYDMNEFFAREFPEVLARWDAFRRSR